MDWHVASELTRIIHKAKTKVFTLEFSGTQYDFQTNDKKEADRLVSAIEAARANTQNAAPIQTIPAHARPSSQPAVNFDDSAKSNTIKSNKSGNSGSSGGLMDKILRRTSRAEKSRPTSVVISSPISNNSKSMPTSPLQQQPLPTMLSNQALDEENWENSVSQLPQEVKKGFALYDYEASTADEVTIYANEAVTIVDEKDRDQGWIRVQKVETGQSGLVPAAYIEIGEHAPYAQVDEIQPPSQEIVEPEREEAVEDEEDYANQLFPDEEEEPHKEMAQEPLPLPPRQAQPASAAPPSSIPSMSFMSTPKEVQIRPISTHFAGDRGAPQSPLHADNFFPADFSVPKMKEEPRPSVAVKEASKTSVAEQRRSRASSTASSFMNQPAKIDVKRVSPVSSTPIPPPPTRQDVPPLSPKTSSPPKPVSSSPPKSVPPPPTRTTQFLPSIAASNTSLSTLKLSIS